MRGRPSRGLENRCPQGLKGSSPLPSAALTCRFALGLAHSTVCLLRCCQRIVQRRSFNGGRVRLHSWLISWLVLLVGALRTWVQFWAPPEGPRGMRSRTLDPACVQKALSCPPRREALGERPWNPNWVTKQFINQRKAASIGHFRLHDLRHFMATQMLGSGIAVPVVSARLAHARASTTLNVYAHAIPGADARAAQPISGLHNRTQAGSIALSDRGDNRLAQVSDIGPAATQPLHSERASCGD